MKTGATRITVGAGLIVGVGAILFGDVALARWTGVKVAPGFWALMFAALLVGCWEFFRMLRRAPTLPAGHRSGVRRADGSGGVQRDTV